MVGATFGSRVRALREAAGVGSRELDRLAGLREGHVAMIEVRRGDVESRTGLAIAAVLGVELSFLSQGEGDPPAEADVRAAVERARAAKSGPATLPVGLP